MKNKVKIFPNPADAILTILVENSTKGRKTLQIINSLGQIMSLKQFTADEIIQDVSNFQYGLYSVVVTSENSVFSNKIILGK